MPVVIDVKELARAVETHAVDAQEERDEHRQELRPGQDAQASEPDASDFDGVACLAANRRLGRGAGGGSQLALWRRWPTTVPSAQWAIDEDARAERLRREGVAIVPREELLRRLPAMVSDVPLRRLGAMASTRRVDTMPIAGSRGGAISVVQVGQPDVAGGLAPPI